MLLGNKETNAGVVKSDDSVGSAEYSLCALLCRWASVSALSNSGTISFRDNHSGSCWCFCREQKATKVNGTHFDDKAGTAKCVFTAIAPGCWWGMTKHEQRGRKMDAPHATPESYAGLSSSVEWLYSHLHLLPLHPHLWLSAPLPGCFTLALVQ